MHDKISYLDSAGSNPGTSMVRIPVRSLLQGSEEGRGLRLVSGEEGYVKRIFGMEIPFSLYQQILSVGKRLGVSKNFREVIDYFQVPPEETPPGFRIEFFLDTDGIVRADLVRDISYDKNGVKRPTRFLFSADSANPYEVAEIKGLIANLTCNPGIIYDLFINNPKANVGGKFKTRDEVMKEIGDILGPGCDISVELNNPYEEDTSKLLEEAARFREILSPYRVVIKVPHTGPINAGNYHELWEGSKQFSLKYNEGSTRDLLRGHNLALLLREHGYRVNFTLMFEPYQTALALQAKPYFINSFIRHRQNQSLEIRKLLALYRETEDPMYLKTLRTFLIEKDYLPPKDREMDLLEVKKLAERILEYRQVKEDERYDGLDGVRHNLRLLRHANLPDTRLIICSMEGEYNYPDIDRLLTEPEFADMGDRILITAEPEYLARFTSSNLVITYQRRFLNAARGQK
ncbi:MAG: transaldolase family protein [Spirochaetes bacterium]|nr:transaldolase family protein [Spirochaetota bacterium]